MAWVALTEFKTESFHFWRFAARARCFIYFIVFGRFDCRTRFNRLHCLVSHRDLHTCYVNLHTPVLIKRVESVFFSRLQFLFVYYDYFSEQFQNQIFCLLFFEKLVDGHFIVYFALIILIVQFFIFTNFVLLQSNTMALNVKKKRHDRNHRHKRFVNEKPFLPPIT